MLRSAPFRKIQSHVITPAGLILGLVLLPSPALTQTTPNKFQKTNPGLLSVFRETVAKPAQSVVSIEVGGKTVGLGTIVGEDGWILTKASLVSDSAVCKLRDGRVLTAKIVGVEEPHDVALLKVEAKGLPVIAWRSSKEAVPGDWVASVGTKEDPVAIGVVSVAARSVSPRSYPRSAPLSGGYLGISSDSEEEGNEGVRIREIQPNTAAAKAKLQLDDVILGIDGQEVKNLRALQTILGRTKADQTVKLKIRRKDAEMEVPVQLGKRPPGTNRADVQNNMGSQLSEKRTGFPNILHHDAVIPPDTCGNPLVDLDGKAIGINISRTGRTESLAIPSDTILAMLPNLKSGKLAPKPAASPEVSKLKEQIAQAEKKIQDLEKKRAAADSLLKEARKTAELLGKDDANSIEIQKRAQESLGKLDGELKTAREALDKLRAELKKAEEKKD